MRTATLFGALAAFTATATVSAMHITFMPRAESAVTRDPCQCVTDNLTQYFDVPKPTGSLLTAFQSYGSELRKPCTAAGTPVLYFPFPAQSSWCGFTTAAPSAVLPAYSSYGSLASSWWSSHSSAAVSLAQKCPVGWSNAMLVTPSSETWLNWNEYDNPSEEENEPYTIYFDPDYDYGFPGQKTIAHAFTYLNEKMKPPLRLMRRLINPYAGLDEQQPLIRGDGASSTSRPTTRDIDVDDDDDVFSVEFPQGYARHYSTFPSIREQKFAAHREKLLFLAMIRCFVTATILLVVSGLLLATGRHKLRAEVDAGVIMGNMVGLVFACLGFNIMLYQWERVGLGQRVVVSGMFVISCLVGGVELVHAMG